MYICTDGHKYGLPYQRWLPDFHQSLDLTVGLAFLLHGIIRVTYVRYDSFQGFGTGTAPEPIIFCE